MNDIYQVFISSIKQTSITEWLIFISALVYVLLATVENIWCWVFGIFSSLLSIYLCYSGKLFLESGLQVFYVFIGFYGWYQWLYGSKEKEALHIISFSSSKIIYTIITGSIVWLFFGIFAWKYSTQALPFLDAFITSFSLIATWLTAKKIIQNWLFWIIIDGLAIVLYGYRQFYLIAFLYFIYTILSVIGYSQWRKKMVRL